MTSTCRVAPMSYLSYRASAQAPTYITYSGNITVAALQWPSIKIKALSFFSRAGRGSAPPRHSWTSIKRVRLKPNFVSFPPRLTMPPKPSSKRRPELSKDDGLIGGMLPPAYSCEPKFSAHMRRRIIIDPLSEGVSTLFDAKEYRSYLCDPPKLRVPVLSSPHPGPPITRFITFGPVIDGLVASTPLNTEGEGLYKASGKLAEFNIEDPNFTFVFELKWSGYKAKYIDMADVFRKRRRIHDDVTKRMLFKLIHDEYHNYFSNIMNEIASADAAAYYEYIPKEERIGPDAMNSYRLCLGFIALNSDGIWRAGPGMVSLSIA